MTEADKDIVRLWDILDAISEIESFARSGSVTKLIQRAVERNIEIIGEAASKISKGLKDKSPQIEWRGMIAVRNILAHDYGNVSQEKILSIIETDIPELKEHIKKILTSL